MSNCIGSSSSSPHGSASRDKPSHVKCLNFGQSILELDVAEQPGCSVTSNRALVIEQNVSRIPCTEKKDYVRKWIETHEKDGPDVSDGLPRVPPIRETSEICGSSPVLGNNRQRHGKSMCINRHAPVRSLGDTNDQEQNVRCYENCMTPDRGSKEEKQDKQEYLNMTQCTPPCTEVIADVSPVLGTHSYPYKRTRRKLQYETKDHILSKRLKLHDDKVTNTHIELASKKSADKLEEDSGSSVKETIFQIKVEESPEKLHMCTIAKISPSQIPERLSSKDSLGHDNKVDSKIEIDTSDKSNEGEYKFSSTNSSINNDNLSNIVEEIKTQDMLPVARTTQHSSKSLFTSRSQSKASQLLASDSNETYCSDGEALQDESIHLSTKISLVPSLTREITESKSTQTPVISTISTPSKVSQDETMYARLLDSGKKPHKARKGSMVAKLQSLINTQVSSIRIWRHRMNKKHEAASARFISVLVRDCFRRFGNQFLRGTLIEDRFNLLQSDVEIEEAECHNVQTPMKEISRRDLTIILVCDIVGTLNMMSEVVINVYPPWDVLDKVDLTLEAMYISIGNEMPNLHSDKGNLRKREKRIVKEFHCPCIEEKREFPFCARKPTTDKPDVMQRIFDF